MRKRIKKWSGYSTDKKPCRGCRKMTGDSLKLEMRSVRLEVSACPDCRSSIVRAFDPAGEVALLMVDQALKTHKQLAVQGALSTNG